MKINKFDRREMIIGVLLATIAGLVLRFIGFNFEGIDYRMSLEPWFLGLMENGTLSGLAEYNGDYNIPYITLLYFLTKLPLEPLYSIKLSSVAFDVLEAVMVLVLVRTLCREKEDEREYLYAFLAYLLVFCNPLVIINSGYLAQCESVWAALALLCFWCLWEGHPIPGFLAFGAAFAMKPQGIFILPMILILYYKRRNFSMLHILWAPVMVELLCIPAILGGCGLDIFIRNLKMMMGHYPYVYYYYPNIWTYLQNAPYYVFGKVGIFSAFAVLLLFVLLLAMCRREMRMQEGLMYIAFTAMTCVMILPCMHERYNYLAELMLPVCALFDKKYRFPAFVLVLCSVLCNGQSYLGWPWVSHEFLAACNIGMYLYLAWSCARGMGIGAGKEEGAC